MLVVATRALWATALAALLAGCVVPVPFPAPRVVRADQAQSSLDVLERLGRFEAGAFRDLERASIPPCNLYVLVHGWAPGWEGQTNKDPRLRAWEVEEFEPWMAALARAILSADPYAIVLAYSWLDDAATGRFILEQRRAFAHTDLHGLWLAAALVAAVREDFAEGEGAVHLIGHSYGARVATLAAVHLPDKPQHLTLFDSPDSAMTHLAGTQAELASLLRTLPIGPRPGQVFVDNYISMVGTPYHTEPGLSAIIDVMLAPPYGVLEYSRRHLYPMDFYAQSARLDFGLGWSPLLAERSPQPGCYHQEYGELSLQRGCPGMP